ncbi:hypothetical protein HM1_1108 [Heliomicrobium modesticaldum Ice1]|uniref:Uncharacterized protein n=1 Tax=Heliobacterium modesticaldum (strain ATCC 51547 / Ice1) TaxID=498761 RepID=B0THM8_HELMI|nr:hypothetical protein HM1_1108 [Heliomicrobium modesticaldum Ice1]
MRPVETKGGCRLDVDFLHTQRFADKPKKGGRPVPGKR